MIAVETDRLRLYHCVFCGAVFRSWLELPPCPTCGTIQPAVVASRRQRAYTRQIYMTIGTVVVLTLLVAKHMLHLHWASQVATAAYLVIASYALMTMWWNPNRNHQRNQDIAEQSVARGHIRLEREGGGFAIQQVHPAAITRGVHWPATVLLTMCAAVATTSEIARLTQDWALNERWFPAVVGPGDTAVYYFDKSFASINGLWVGDCEGDVVNGQALGIDEPLCCKSAPKEQEWGDSISIRRSDHSTAKEVFPFTKLIFSHEGKLAGQTVSLNLVLRYRCPRMGGGPVPYDPSHHSESLSAFYRSQRDGFHEEEGTIRETTILAMSQPHAGRMYQAAGIAGITGGGLLLVLAISWLYHQATLLSRRSYGA